MMSFNTAREGTMSLLEVGVQRYRKRQLLCEMIKSRRKYLGYSISGNNVKFTARISSLICMDFLRSTQAKSQRRLHPQLQFPAQSRRSSLSNRDLMNLKTNFNFHWLLRVFAIASHWKAKLIRT